MKTAAKAHKPFKDRDIEFLDGAPEVAVFMACFGMIAEVRKADREEKEGLMTRKDFNKLFKAVIRQFKVVAASTYRFDIVCPVSEVCTLSPFFWRWYNWWDDYLKTLPPDTIYRLEKSSRDRNERELAAWYPPGDWVDYRKQPAFTLLLL